MNNQIEIPISKNKIYALLIGVIIFIFGGIWMMLEPGNGRSIYIPFIKNAIYISPEVIQIIGGIGVLFFGACGVFGFRKLFDKKAGLIIDSNGITDNSNATSIGLIEWNDIINIRTRSVMSTKFLLIDVINPEKYIAKAKNKMQAKLLQVNNTSYKTPISITSNTLKYDFRKLEQLIREEFESFKNSN